MYFSRDSDYMVQTSIECVRTFGSVQEIPESSFSLSRITPTGTRVKKSFQFSIATCGGGHLYGATEYMLKQ